MSERYKIDTVCCNGVETDYLTFGGGKKTFVILPGLSIGSVLSSADAIVSAYACFDEDYTVILFDRRKNPPEEYPIEDMAEDTAAAMKALGLSGVDLFGVSQGGMIAQVIAAKHPFLVGRLILGSTSSRVDGGAAARLQSFIDLALQGEKMKLCAAFSKLLYTDAFLEKYGTLLKLSMLKVHKKDLRRFCILARGCLGFSFTEELSKIGCPVLVLGAENDQVLPCGESLVIAEKLGCACYLYPAPYGHAVYDEAPDYKERILDFLKK